MVLIHSVGGRTLGVLWIHLPRPAHVEKFSSMQLPTHAWPVRDNGAVRQSDHAIRVQYDRVVYGTMFHTVVARVLIKQRWSVIMTAVVLFPVPRDRMD